MTLDDAYANGDHIANAAAYPPRWADAAEAFRKALSAAGRARLGLAYGASVRQALDLFLPEGQASGLTVFVHGGFWRLFDRSSWSHLAEGAVARGQVVAMPSYDLCPEVRIADITRQIATAVSFAAGQASGPIRLTGHSAGGHLVARMLAPGMLPDAVARRIVHVMPISPLSDLRPLLQTAMNDDFRMDAAMAEAESPLLQPRPEVPVTVWVGADERPAFLDQARWLAEAWGATHVTEPARHHFDVIDGLVRPDSAMMNAFFGTG